MAPKSKGGRFFIQDKDKLLKLAETIASDKELDIRQKVDRTKAAGSSHDGPSRRASSRRPKSGSVSASDKLRVAKEFVAARKTKRKREKIKARKSQTDSSNSASAPKPNGAASGVSLSPRSTSRKRVSFSAA